MTYALRILPAADVDVDDAAMRIAQDSLDVAYRFYDAVDQTYRMIRDHPNRWPRYELTHLRLSNLHKRAVKGFNKYLIFYRIQGGAVEIIRVLHGARDIPAILGDEVPV